jgi:peroxiredoxin
MTIQIGDTLPDLILLRPDGKEARLSDFPRPLLLIFLRHLH